jgi:outer membrane biosynthesis protein TonB
MLYTVRSLPARPGLAVLAALALALAAAFALAPRAAAWYCPPGTHESPPDSGQCVPDKPTPTTPEATPPVQPEQPVPKPEQPHPPAPPQSPPPAAVPAPQPQPQPAAVPAPAPQPAPAVVPAPSSQPEQAVQQTEAAEVTRPRRERPNSAVRGEVSEESAPVAPQRAQPPAELPFTGVDAALIALVGIVFLGAGLLLRRHRVAVAAAFGSSRGEIVAAVPGRTKVT